MKNFFSKTLIAYLGLLLGIFAITIILGVPVMLLWNWLVPSIFGITKITIWEAVGISLLCSILFKSINIK